MKRKNAQPPPLFQNPEADGSSFEWMTNSNTGIVCLHGFTATTVEVRTFARELHKMGYCVNGPLLPGHGVSPEEMNKVRWEDWFDAADSAFQRMERQCENIFLVGESTGALLSILLAIKHPRVKGLLLFAPALKIPGLWMSRIVWPFKQYIYKKNVDLTSPWQGFNVIPLHGASELARLQMKVRRELSGVKAPMILFQGKKDQTIDPMSAVIVLEKAGSTDKQLVWLEESPHVILLEGPLSNVVTLSAEFIRTHL